MFWTALYVLEHFGMFLDVLGCFMVFFGDVLKHSATFLEVFKCFWTCWDNF